MSDFDSEKERVLAVDERLGSTDIQAKNGWLMIEWLWMMRIEA